MSVMDQPERCTGFCGRQPGPGQQVSWSPVFGAWLCAECRAAYTSAELMATERVNVSRRETG